MVYLCRKLIKQLAIQSIVNYLFATANYLCSLPIANKQTLPDLGVARRLSNDVMLDQSKCVCLRKIIGHRALN